MRVRIKAIHAVAAWRWDLPEDSDDTCGICQNEFDATCSNCKFPGDDCPLQTGQCKHTFHSHCVDKWLSQSETGGKCPMCRQPFESQDAASRLESAATAATPQTGVMGPPELPPPRRTPQTPATRQAHNVIQGTGSGINSPPEAADLSESSDDREGSQSAEEMEAAEDDDEEVENTDSMELG